MAMLHQQLFGCHYIALRYSSWCRATLPAACHLTFAALPPVCFQPCRQQPRIRARPVQPQAPQLHTCRMRRQSRSQPAAPAAPPGAPPRLLSRE